MARTFGKKFSDGARSGWALTRETGASLLAYQLYPLGIPGYPIPILPPSGVMQVAVYETVNAEVHERQAP